MSIVGLIVIVVIWILLKIVLTFAIPESVSGPKYLRQQLAAHDIEVANISPEFLHEASRWAQGIAQVAKLERRGRARSQSRVRARPRYTRTNSSALARRSWLADVPIKLPGLVSCAFREIRHLERIKVFSLLT